MTSASLIFTCAALIFSLNAKAEVHLPDDPAREGTAQAEPPAANPDRTIEALELKEPPSKPADQAAILAKYKHLDPTKIVARSILNKAILYYDTNIAKFTNRAYLGVVDFSIKSRNARWFVIDLKTGSVWAIHVAHGNKSDVNGDGIPETFSNVDGSNMSSLGVYRTAETYESEKFGHSLRVDGLSKTNSNVRSRAIVVHPAWYVWESSTIAPGRTYGCLGVSKSVSQKLIDGIKNGSMIYVGLSTAK